MGRTKRRVNKTSWWRNFLRTWQEAGEAKEDGKPERPRPTDTPPANPSTTNGHARAE